MAVLYQAVRNGCTEATTPDVEQVTGKAPVTFEEFAKKNADRWR